MDPINYLAGVPQIDFGQRFLSGLQAGAGIGEIQQQADARALALQQKQLAQQQALQYNEDVKTALANPTPQAFSALALKYPSQREAVKQSWDGLSAADQKAEGDTMSQAYAALLSGQPDVAKKVVQDQIDARKNSGLDTSHFDNALTLLDTDPTKAQAALGFTLSHIGDPKDFAAKYGTLQKLPGEVADQAATTAGKVDDNTLKGQQITAQKAGALAKVSGLKPAQVLTFLQSEANAGRIAPDDAATLKANVPTDAADLPGFLNSIMTSGIKPDDQQKYVAPTADAQLSARTQVQTTGMNNSTQLAVQDRIDARAKADAESGGDGTDFTKAAIDNAAARYNLDGSLPPMGMGKAASAGRTAILNRAAELKAGVDPEQQRRDQLNNKAGIANQNKVIQAFNTGKEGKAVRSFNVLLSHLDTLDSLSDALDNGNVQLINRLGNAYAKATGNAAPTNFDAVKHIVGDEVVKAVTGGAGALGDRESIAKAIDGANSPAQLKGVIKNFKDLSVGQLNGLEQQYRAGSQRDDFEHYLDAPARLMRSQHGGARAAPAGPAVGTVDSGFRFKGGDPSQPSNWERVR